MSRADDIRRSKRAAAASLKHHQSKIKMQDILPTKPNRCVFRDASNPGNKHEALLNPENLSINTSVNVGELAPIGWTQPVQQYANTAATSVSLSLQYSTLLYREFNAKVPKPQEPYNFFRSFLYGRGKGFAPSYLIVSIPNTMTMATIVRSVNIEIERWDTGMTIRGYTIDLELTEVRENFLTSKDVRQQGFMKMDPVFSSHNEVGRQNKTGTPTKMSKNQVRRMGPV